MVTLRGSAREAKQRDQRLRNIQNRLRENVADIELSWHEDETELMLQDFIKVIDEFRNAAELGPQPGSTILCTIQPITSALHEVRARAARYTYPSKPANHILECGRDLLRSWTLFVYSWITLHFSPPGSGVVAETRVQDITAKKAEFKKRIGEFWKDDQSADDVEVRSPIELPSLDNDDIPSPKIQAMKSTPKPSKDDASVTVINDSPTKCHEYLTPGLGLQQWIVAYDQERFYSKKQEHEDKEHNVQVDKFYMS